MNVVTLNTNFKYVINAFFMLYAVLVALILGPGLIAFSFILRTENEPNHNSLLWLMFSTGVMFNILISCYVYNQIKKICYPDVKIETETNPV